MALKQVRAYFETVVNPSTGKSHVGLHVLVNGKAYEVTSDAGSNDGVEAFFDDKHVWVISWNENYPYVGLDRFTFDKMRADEFNDKDREVYFQGDDVQEVLGKRGVTYSPRHMVRVLSTWV